MNYPKSYLENVCTIAKSINLDQIEKMMSVLVQTRERAGRLFVLGVGGSAANCTHAVNDFRKICGIEAYAPVDNVAELTARTNDEGWHTVFSEWLRVSRLNANDTLLILSVGGGNKEKNVSANLVLAMELAKERGSKILGIVGRDGGFTAKVADACVVIPTVSQDQITPQAEAWQGVIWHMLVSDPRLMAMSNKWESIDKGAAQMQARV